MTQRFFPNSIYFISLISLLLFTACSPAINTDKGINHVILLWLKADTTPTDIEAIIQATQQLQQIESIQAIHIGRAIPSTRKIVDDSFSLGIHMRFANQQSMQSYLSHPQHIKFVDTYIKPKLEKLLVYDF